MQQKTSNWIYLYTVPILLVVFYASEAYFKILEYYFNSTTFILKAIKLVVLCAACGFVLYKKPSSFLLPILLAISFVIGQITLNGPLNLEAITGFGKLIYPILLLLFFNIYQLSDSQKHWMLKTFEFIFLLNSVLVILGFCFDILVFKTYLGNRFGFNGLLITSSTGSYFYIITLIYLFFRDKEKLFKKMFNFIVFLAALLVGTKALYLFTIVLIGLFVFWFVKGKMKHPILLIIGTLTVFFGYFYLFEHGTFNNIRQADGLLSAIMSYRDQLLLQKTIPYINSNWQFLNYLFGGVNDLSTRSQIDIIDVFYFFGIIGGALYLFIFFKIFLTFKINLFMGILLGFLLLIIFFAGNFFSFASIAIYTVILREFLKKT